jgi:hypothetical protein
MNLIKLSVYAIGWIVGVYLFNAALARRFQKLDTKLAILYIATMATLGVFGEVAVGTFYNHFFHSPLWVWRVFPIYKGYTSLYAPFLWGIYGFQLYLFHDNLAKRHITNDNEVAVIFGFETIILEILLNLSFLAFFGHLIFYYTPRDLWHFTSIQALPFFFIASLIFTKAIRRYKSHEFRFTVLNVALCFALVALE